MVAKKKVKKKSSTKSISDATLHKLLDSNLKLQNKMTDVLIGVKELNENVSSLVTIFKKAGDHIKSGKYEDPMINKINDLLEQNKHLQQAIMLMEKYIKDKNPSRPNPLNKY